MCFLVYNKLSKYRPCDILCGIFAKYQRSETYGLIHDITLTGDVKHDVTDQRAAVTPLICSEDIVMDWEVPRILTFISNWHIKLVLFYFFPYFSTNFLNFFGKICRPSLLRAGAKTCSIKRLILLKFRTIPNQFKVKVLTLTCALST